VGLTSNASAELSKVASNTQSIPPTFKEKISQSEGKYGNPTDTQFGNEVRHQILAEMGIPKKDAERLDYLLTAYGGGISEQKYAMEQLGNPTPEIKRAIEAQTQLELLSYNTLMKYRQRRVDELRKDYESAESELRQAWEANQSKWADHYAGRSMLDPVFRGNDDSSNRYIRDMTSRVMEYGGLYVEKGEMNDFNQFKAAVERAAPPPPKTASDFILYRAGAVGQRKIESWSNNEDSTAFTGERGAVSFLKDGDELTAVPMKELISRGYIPLGGFSRPMGSPGESEITMIKGDN
jgi:hypothetical protein